MITKKQAMDNIYNSVQNCEDEEKKKKYIQMMERIELMSDEEFDEKLTQILGEDVGTEEFNNWFQNTIDEMIQASKIIPLNEFVSYNDSGNTIGLHVGPEHVTIDEIKNSGTFLVDALEKLKSKIEDGEFEQAESIFAVSDILKLKTLQKYLSDLGFEIEKGDEAFEGHFKNPYQAKLSKEFLLSDEWEKIKDEFMRDKPSIEKLRRNRDKEDISR